jgi:molybdate transport system substrate-binding protein
MNHKWNGLRSRGLKLIFLAVALGPTKPSAAQLQKIRVAAAADLQPALTEIAAAYQKQTGTQIEAVYGSSGNIFAQIQNGAPFDVFFSADIEYPQRLADAGFVESGSSAVYALGRIVLFMPAGAACKLQREQWRCLQDSSVKKIAIANPQHAPYGSAAVEALKKAGIYEQLKTKLVYGENISQTAQFVESGNAQAGILAYSLATSAGLSGGQRWEIPPDFYPSIRQTVVVLKAAANRAAAQEFVNFVIKGPGRALLLQHDFLPPPIR